MGPPGGSEIRFPDQGLLGTGAARLCKVRVRRAEVRRRRVPAAWHDLRRAAQGDLAAGRVGYRRGYRLAVDPRHQGAGRLHGRHAPDDAQRHVRHQRHRARDRLADASLAGRVLRPRQGKDPFVGQVPLCRPGDPLSRLVAGLRVRRQGPCVRAYRPSAQAAGDDAADGARCRQHRRSARCRRTCRQEIWMPARSAPWRRTRS